MQMYGNIGGISLIYLLYIYISAWSLGWCHTVDGRNPVPVVYHNIPLLYRVLAPSQVVVSDFFHQQYVLFHDLLLQPLRLLAVTPSSPRLPPASPALSTLSDPASCWRWKRLGLLLFALKQRHVGWWLWWKETNNLSVMSFFKDLWDKENEDKQGGLLVEYDFTGWGLFYGCCGEIIVHRRNTFMNQPVSEQFSVWFCSFEFWVIPYKMGTPPKRAPEPAKSLKSLSCHISFAIFLHVNRHSKKALCNFNTRSYINCWHGMVVYLRLVALETAPPPKKNIGRSFWWRMMPHFPSGLR